VLPVVRVAPMICVVFVAVGSRVNAAALHAGSPMSHLPRGFFGSPGFGIAGLRGTEAAVGVCALALCILAILRYHAERDAIREADERQIQDTDSPGGGLPETAGQSIKLCNTLYRWVAAAMYFLVFALLLRIFVMRTTSGFAPPLEPSVLYSAILAGVYFGIHLFILALDSRMHAPCSSCFGPHTGFIVALLKLADLNMNFAPMICALFLALQAGVDSVGAYEPSDLSYLVRTTTVATLIQTALAVGGAALCGAELAHREATDLVIAIESHPWLLFLLTSMRWVCMIVLVFGVLELTERLLFLQSATQAYLICFLTLAYFFVHLALWITMLHLQSKKTLDEHIHNLHNLSKAKEIVDIACPLLAILRVSWWIAGGIDF
jgi:hypothetical protein